MVLRWTFLLLWSATALLLAEDAFTLGDDTAPLAEVEEPYINTFTGGWGGWRAEFRKQGMEATASLIADLGWNMEGGRKTSGTKGEYLFNGVVKAHSEEIIGYSGGTFVLNFAAHHGQSPSLEVGSLVLVDSIEAPPFNALYELYYQQTFGHKGRHWLLVGKSDAYDNFALAPHVLSFVNNGYSAAPTILFFPTYPNSAMSLIGSFKLSKSVTGMVGLFDGSFADGFQTGSDGVFGRFFNHLSDHAFIIGELDLNWDWGDGRIGLFKVGEWWTTASLEEFSGCMRRGSTGPYVILDQIFLKKEQKEAAFFGIYGWANPNVSSIVQFYCAGVTYQGFCKSRQRDQIGFAWTISDLSKEAPDLRFFFENVLEGYYRIGLWRGATLQPDLQIIFHPSGIYPTSYFATIRFQMNF